jgi:hypothetical protein
VRGKPGTSGQASVGCLLVGKRSCKQPTSVETMVLANLSAGRSGDYCRAPTGLDVRIY